MNMKTHEPYRKLKGELKSRELCYTDIAALLNISSTAVSHKINGKSDFYISQVLKIQKTYGIDLQVFLN